MAANLRWQQRPLRCARAVAAVLVSTALVSGCGTSNRDQPVLDTAAEFHRALDARDGAAACALLTSAARSEVEQSAGKPCASAILDQKLPAPTDAGTAAVFETAAQVRYGGETVFLARFPDGWRVSAAGCTARDARPYDCTVSGG